MMHTSTKHNYSEVLMFHFAHFLNPAININIILYTYGGGSKPKVVTGRSPHSRHTVPRYKRVCNRQAHVATNTPLTSLFLVMLSRTTKRDKGFVTRPAFHTFVTGLLARVFGHTVSTRCHIYVFSFYLSIYLFIYQYIHIHMYLQYTTCIYIYLHINIYISVYRYVLHTHTHIYIYTYTSVCIYTHIYICIYIYIYRSIFIYQCIYIYISYMYTYISICTYIYIHINLHIHVNNVYIST